MTDERLQQAIAFVQSGNMDAAREQLEIIIKAERNNISAWHWYSQTWPKASDRERVWQLCLRHNPGNELAQEALKDLQFAQAIKAAPGPESPIRARRSRVAISQWLTWLSITVLSAAAVFVWREVRQAAPKDPEQYKHVQPVEYYLYVPENYSAEREWPLFIGIHGAGGNGLQCWQLWQAYADREGFILLCPSIPGSPDGFYQDVGETTVWSAVMEVKKEYRVKPRMFMAGFSAGAFFIQGFTYHYPAYVSGLSILSAGLYINPSAFAELVPILVVIGDADHPVTVRNSQYFVDGLRQYTFDVQYKVMPDVGHAVTEEGVNMTLELFRKTIDN